MNSAPARRSPLFFIVAGLNVLVIGSLVLGSTLLPGAPAAASPRTLTWKAPTPTSAPAAAHQPTPWDAFLALQARAGVPLHAQWDPVTGIPEFLTPGDPSRRLPYTPTAAERGNAVAIARGFLDENRALFRLGSAMEEFTLLRIEPDLQLNYAHVRLNQTYKGLPVFGRQLVVHLDPQGVINSTADLIYEGQSGALNESYADVFGALIDRGNWAIGEQVVKSPPFPTRMLRSLEDPTLGGRYDPRNPLAGVGQPRTMREYANLPISRRADNGGVHINSGIPNHAAYLLASAIGLEKMEQIYYRALTQYLTPRSNFLQAANATVRAAADLYGQAEIDAVRKAFGQVGINVGGSDAAPRPPAEGGPSIPARGGSPAPPGSPQLPAGCTEVVADGGFESGSPWVQESKSPIIDSELAYAGDRSAWLGGTDQETTQIIYQRIRLPANATRVEFSYYRLIHEEMAGGLLGSLFGKPDAARFNVLVANEQGDLLGAIEQLTSEGGDDTWRQARFDVSELAGKTIQLAFSAENPRGNISSFFVDEVSMIACTTGQGPAAPKTSASDLVYLQGTVSDADTGRGIYGAQVFIIKPGLSATQAAADDAVTASEVSAMAVTDQRGFFRTDKPIQSGQTYGVIIIARGYRPIIANDAASIPGNASNPFPLDATMRRSR
jgi:hypothetical protein